MNIGWSKRDISTTEPTCIHGQFHIRISKGILDPIFVTALVIEDNNRQAVFLSTDTTSFNSDTITMIRNNIRMTVPEVDASKVIMNATHTHCTGDVNGIGMCKPGVDFPCDPAVNIQHPGDYQKFFAQQCADAIAEAWHTRKAGAVAWGYGYAAVAYSRKVWYFDDLSQRESQSHGARSGMAVNGHAAMYGNTADSQFSHYEAGADHFINFLYTFDAQEKLTGAIINLPCPSQCSESEEKLTADYWHDVRQMLYQHYGDIYVLGQCAPAGDLSPHILHYRAAQNRRLLLKYGSENAYREQHERRDIAEKICASFTEVLSWAQKDIRSSVNIRNSIEQIALQRRQPTQAEIDSEKDIYTNELLKLPYSTSPDPYVRFRDDSVTAARRNRSQAFIALAERAQKGEPFITDLHVIAIDDIAFVSNPFELYQDFMHRIQARSPFLQTFAVQLADNDKEYYAGYLATQRGVEGGGYSSSRYCNLVSPEGGQQLVEATLATLNKLK